MIIDIVDIIASDIETNSRFGLAVSGAYSVNWASWDNQKNRVIVLMFSSLPLFPLTGIDLTDAVNRFGIVWGVRSYEYTGEGIIHIDSLRIIDDPLTDLRNKDDDDDEIVR